MGFPGILSVRASLGWRVGGILSGAFSVRLSLLTPLSRIGGSRKGVPSGEEGATGGEIRCWSSLGLLCLGAEVAPGAADVEGLAIGPRFSSDLWSCFPGGVVAGLNAGLTEAAAVGFGEMFSKRGSLSLPLLGGAIGLADVAGAAGAVWVVGIAGLAAVAGIGLAAVEAFALGVKLGVGAALGSSFFIFSFNSV